MFCSQCGKPAQGKFCSNCGYALTGSGSAVLVVNAAIAGTEVAKPDVVQAENVELQIVPDWDHEVRYEEILQYPGVRTMIDRHARLAPKTLTGEQFLALADKVIPMGVSMEGLAPVAQTLLTRLGIKTGKHRTQQVPAPAAKVLLRTLCSLARHGQSLRTVTQAADGCLLEAVLPSDMFSLAGDLLVSVRRGQGAAEVDATVRIGGQMFDWGKSNRCLNQLFDDLTRDAA